VISTAALNEVYATSMLQRLERASAEHPDKVLLECDGRAITRAQLSADSERLAAALHVRGVVDGNTVGVLGGNSVWHHLTLWACLRLGAQWSPMNPGLRPAELGYTLVDLDPAVLFIEEELFPTYVAARETTSLAKPLMTIALGEPAVATDASITDLIAEGSDPSTIPTRRSSPGDPAYIMYSGGTTGLPKGVVLPQAVAPLAAVKYAEALDLQPDDVFFSSMQMYHFWPLMVLSTALFFDLTCCMSRRFSASRWLDQARACGATIVDPFLPMVAMLMNRIPERPDDADNRIRRSMMGCGPDEFTQDIRARFEKRFGLKVHNMYGLTEAPNITYEYTGATRDVSTGPTGEWFDVQIVDEDDMPLAAGDVGEITFRPRYPHQIALGYRNQAAKTVEVWKNLWVHSGDLGCLDADGYLYFRGRMAHFARIRGENVSLSEVEAVAEAHPEVIEAGAVAVASPLGEDDIKLCVALKAPLQPEELIAWLDERLARFKIPRYVQVVESLPRSVTKQEVERFKLKELDTAVLWDRESASARGVS
jgi:crotonobetaine/carnitine-CoA ligase